MADMNEVRYTTIQCPTCRIQTKGKITGKTVECTLCGTRVEFKNLYTINRQRERQAK